MKKRTQEHNQNIGLANIREAPDGKVCPKCSEWKPTDDFGYRSARNSLGRRYLRGICRKCSNTEYYHKKKPTPEFTRKVHLKRKYGLTPEQYEEMLESQGGRCAVCRLSSDRVLHVDHCHATGRIRGLLCGYCNQALGLAFDSPERLRALADYLERR